MPRLTDADVDIDYRHVVGSLLRKPGGFERYVYRESLFPRLVFRKAWENLRQRYAPRKANLMYLQVLQLAATTIEADVAHALRKLLSDAVVQEWDYNTVKTLVQPNLLAPSQLPLTPDLTQYDAFLSQGVQQ